MLTLIHFFYSVGLFEAAQYSFENWLTSIGVSRRINILRRLLPIKQGLLRAELVTGANLSNYNQDNTELNGLAGLVSFAPTTGKLFSIQGGNGQLPLSAWKQAQTKHCPKETTSRMHVKEEYVTTAVATDTSFELFTQSGRPLGEFDVVILAAPLQHSRINFLKQSHFDPAVLSELPLNGLVIDHEDADANPQEELVHREPPPLPSSATRTYRQTITTVVSHGEFQPEYFHFDKQKASPENYAVPKSIYMTVEGKAQEGISSISHIPSRSIPGVYKMFSSEPLELSKLQQIFGPSVKLESTQVWGGPYGGAYPSFDGGTPQSLPFLLYDGGENKKDDGPTLFYINGMEAAVAAIEISAIGAKSVAKLVARKLGFIKADTTDTTMSEEL